MKLLNTVSVVAGIVSGLWNVPLPVSAADLSRVPQIVQPIMPAVPFSWTTAYVGGTVGGGFGTFNSSVGTSSGDVNADGIEGGGFFGVRHQFFGTPWVLGAEGDLLATGQSASFCALSSRGRCFAPASLKADWIGDASAQFGYAFGSEGRVLAYVEGGPSGGTASWTVANNFSGDVRGFGYHVGFGVDYVPAMWGDHVGFGLKYRFTHLDGPDLAVGGGGTVSTSFEDNSVLGRVFYRFPY